MRSYRFDRRIWIFIFTTSLVIPLFYQLRGWVTGNDYPYFYFLMGMVFTFIVTLAITLVNFKIISKFLDSRFPWTNNTKKITSRIIVEVIVTSLNAALIISIIAIGFDLMVEDVPQEVKGTLFFDNIVVALIVNFIAMSIIEANQIFTKWTDSQVLTERLEKENIETQFNALKNQVNPHFLFNSLNVLNSLITTDKEKAKEFVGEFSKIFRYVFDVGEEMVVDVEKEISFIKSYISLQQKRYGDNLVTSINIDASKLHYLIPVLSLQILVENAIKHNEISDNKPLTIEIFDDRNTLVVRNNIQLRDEDIHSTGIGLKNLKERYQLLSIESPDFIASRDYYTARLPLLLEE